jgi:hypothetical protein
LRNSNEFLLPPEKQGEKDKTKRELVKEMMNTPLGIAKGHNALSKMLLQDLQKSAANLGIDTKNMSLIAQYLSGRGEVRECCRSFGSRYGSM